jgi:thiol:disulfide interchange protein DsbD
MTRLASLTAVLLTLAASHVFAASDEDLLEPDKAFALSTRVVDGTTLEATWKIAPGYYMYRDKLKFEVAQGAVTLKASVLPTGKVKADPLFGNVETYTKSVTARLPLERKSADAQTVKLRIGGQGCNEPIGVCYPPITKEISFNLPALKVSQADTSPAAPAAGGLKSLKELARAIESPRAVDEPVDPEKAFRLRVDRHPQGVLVHFDIDECCYLYRDKIRFALVRRGGALPGGAKLGAYSLPPGKVKTDEFIGTTEVYTKSFAVTVPISGVDQVADAMLKVHYQGCSEKGVAICYPPTSKEFSLAPGAVAGAAPLAATATEAAPSSAPATSPAREPRDVHALVLAMLAAFGAGLLLTFTPCVLPMVPILSSIIVGSGESLSKLRGGLLSYSYVLGTAATYTIGGVLAGVTGDQLQAYFQNAWTIGIFSAVLALLALSMFGFYELQMPGFVQTRLSERTRAIKGGAMLGVFVLGMISALIVGACASPVLLTLLGAAILSQDPVLGGGIMLALAHGQGVLLIAIGVGAGWLLPKAGLWMERVKQIFGVMLLAVAIYLIGTLPQVPVLFLWAALFVISAVYLGATQSLPEDAGGWSYFRKGVGTLLLIWGVFALLGGIAGERDILKPLPLSGLAFGTGATAKSAAIPRESAGSTSFERVRSARELDERLAAARNSGKPVFVDYFADWCTDCARMENSTFADQRVRAALEDFVRLKVDVTDPNDPEVKKLKERYRVFAPPAYIFLSKQGEPLPGAVRGSHAHYGFHGVDELIGKLAKVR